MSKAVLIIDMPESCDTCPLMVRHDEERCCIPESRNSFSMKPDWCPLKAIDAQDGTTKSHTSHFDDDDVYSLGI